MKVTSNTETLLKLLLAFVVSLCAIFVYGIATRVSPNNLRIVDGYQIVSGMQRANVQYLRNEALRMQSRYSASYIEYLTSELERCKRDLEIASLSPMARYVNYAYEIVDDYYPDVIPEYVCAIIYRESRFDPNAVNSRTGVKGLTQINPKWHSKRASDLGVDDLFDPYGNILVCCDILDELTSQRNFSYALDFYAGGYSYANKYVGSSSPVSKELFDIMNTQNFEQYVLPYRITEKGGVS